MRSLFGKGLLVLVVVLVAGCGAHKQKPVQQRHFPRMLAVSCPPPRGEGFMGVCAPHPKLTGPKLKTPAGGLFPDVSLWQGYVNWPAVKAWQLSHAWKPAAVFKIGEYRIDPFAARNSAETLRLGMWRAGYWFVRNTGCSSESQQIIAAARSFRLRIVALDMEVREAYGYGHCLAAPLRAAGFIVMIYAAPGVWPGGPSDGLPAWIATFGRGFSCLPWTCRPVAWQFTDGRLGSPTYVPGIGYADVSVDYGVTRLAPPPPPLKCFGSRADVRNATCRRVRAQVAGLARARDASYRAYVRRGGVVLSQRIAWYSARIKADPRNRRTASRRRALAASQRAFKRNECKVFAARASYFQQRINQVINQH